MTECKMSLKRYITHNRCPLRAEMKEKNKLLDSICKVAKKIK